MYDIGDNILVPRPGFPLYQVITESLGGHVKQYMLNVSGFLRQYCVLSDRASPIMQADREWECDLEDMDAQIDEHTKAILITNPSNPCGSNFTREHLVDIVAVARYCCLSSY